MEKIDIILKAMLEIKDQMSILDYKIDNLEAKIDSLSSIKIESLEVQNQENEKQSTEDPAYEEQTTDFEEPTQDEDDGLTLGGGEPEDDPHGKSEEEIAKEIEAEKSAIFKNGQYEEDKLWQALQIEADKKKEASAKTLDTIEEIKKKQQKVKQFSELVYDITKHLNM